MNKVYTEIEQYVQRSSAENTDDSDDEGPRDEEIPPAFSECEFAMFLQQLREVHRRYHQAIGVNFQNAYGKLFLMEFCEFLLPKKNNLGPCALSGWLQGEGV